MTTFSHVHSNKTVIWSRKWDINDDRDSLGKLSIFCQNSPVKLYNFSRFHYVKELSDMNFTGVTFSETKHSSEVIASSKRHNKHLRSDLITS